MTSQNTYWIYGGKISRALLIASVISGLSLLMVVVVELTVTDSTVQFPTTGGNISLFLMVAILVAIAILAQFFLWLSMIYFIAFASGQPVGLRALLLFLQLVLVSFASLIVYLTVYRPRLRTHLSSAGRPYGTA
jgi:hypothetical protein